MTLEPLLNASPAIQFHVFTVVPAALIGGILLLRKKGTFAHRMTGRVWIVLMVLTALSTFMIHEIDLFHGFSPIHLLSILTLFGAFIVVQSARQRNFIRHQRVVKMLYFGGIGIAGFFTFMPGRIMHEVVFGLPTLADAALSPSAPMALQVAHAAPIWVWPLLVALIGLGISRMRDRDMPLWRLMLLPVILVASSLITALTGQTSGSGLAALMSGLALGALAGWWSLLYAEVEWLSGNRVRVKGEVVSLIAILAIFACRFIAGAMAVVLPQMMAKPGVAELFIALPVFCAALMAARALAQAGFNPLTAMRQQLVAKTEC
ncbi:putative membrane protein [Hoeflea sp. IMCC20628]|uniref:DUF2306 domain-containing protein n=1 Tax=Hoeflea sp. IMCC20628 TaxID=1620421 RepID=UPI00063BF284|nr:DUF2306 domain-containing protein [Hoeflea sp. IMCC20628]AKH99484.1 putative membrane protein [Hoeflea sp. IMCC20628]